MGETPAQAWPDVDADSGHSCSTCAAYCATAALPSHGGWVAAPVLADVAGAGLPRRWAAVSETGLERPPKRLVD